MFKRVKTLIKAKFYKSRAEAVEKCDTLYYLDKLTSDEYKELLALIEKTYKAEA